MNGTTAIAITGIVVSGVVGPGLAAWWSRQRQRDDLRQQRKAALAEVLDQSANSLGIARRAFERVYLLVSNDVPPGEEEAQKAGQDWRAALTEVRYCQDRLAIRVGRDNPVHAAYGACVDNLERRRVLAWSYEQDIDTTKAQAVESKAHQGFAELRAAYLDACTQLLDAAP